MGPRQTLEMQTHRRADLSESSHARLCRIGMQSATLDNAANSRAAFSRTRAKSLGDNNNPALVERLIGASEEAKGNPATWAIH